MTAGSPAGGRLASGNQQLDAILGGGFPAHAINLVVGPPGWRQDHPGPAVRLRATQSGPPSTSRPSPSRWRRSCAMARRWPSSTPRRSGGRCSMRMWVSCSAPRTVRSAGADRRAGQEHRPGMLVVDSFKALGFYAADQGEFRQFLHSLSGRLSAFPIPPSGGECRCQADRAPGSPSPTPSSA